MENFKNGNDFYQSICEETIYYSPSHQLYAFSYNLDGSICVFNNVTKEDTFKIDAIDESYGKNIPHIGTAIYDGNDAIEWCNEHYSISDWHDVTKK